MKKRLLSLLLLFTLLVSAMPLGALSLLSFAAEPEEMTEDDYNDLYVTSDLVLSMDFFKLNEYWSPDGHSYAIPEGPSDDSDYYDATTGKTFDFTVDNNRYAYTVEKTAADTTVTTVGTYLGEAEANEAVAALTAAETEGATYAAVKGTATNMAWRRCVSAWLEADKALFASFTNYAATIGGKTAYLSSCDNGFSTTTSGNRMSFARSAIASLDNGYVTLLPTGRTYTGGGGLQLLGNSDSLGTLETVTVLGGSLNTSSGGYVLFNNLALIPTKNATDGTYTIKGAATDRSVGLGTLTSAKPFPYDEIASLTYTMKDGEFAMYHGTETVATAPYTGTTSASHYFGWAGRSYSTEIYAIRYYLDVLTAEERAQNHFADIAKFFRLDVSDFAAKRSIYGAEALGEFYAAFAAIDFTSTGSEAQAAFDAAFAVLDVAPIYPDITAEDYNSLYVAEDRLFQADFFPLNPYWDRAEDYGTIEVADTGSATEANTINWLKQFLVSGTTTPVFRLEHGNAYSTDAEGTYSPHVPFHIKGGYLQFKEPSETVAVPPYLQVYFSKNYTVGEKGFTMESLLRYDAVTPGKTSNVWLPWAFGLTPKLTLSSSSAFKITSSAIWSASYSLASQPTFTHNGDPFTLAYSIETDGSTSSAEILANGTALTTGSLGKVDGGATINIGYYCGSYGMKLYAIRLYDRSLTDAELRQNHFADIAKFFRLDVAELLQYAPFCEEEALDAFYAAFGELDFTATRDEAQAVCDAAYAILEDTIELSGQSESYYNALYVKRDLLFQLDFFTLNAIWGRAEEYGTLEAADTSNATKSAVVAWLNQFRVANPGNVTMAIQGTRGDDGATSFEHQIPFHIGSGYIQYKNVNDGYTVADNNPYIQFKPASTDVYHNGGFTWELAMSLDRFSKSGTFYLPALSDLRPRATTSAPTSSFTVTGASGFTVANAGTLNHAGKAFELTYRMEVNEGSYDTVLSAGETLLGSFETSTAYAGQVCDFGWNFNESDAKIYAVRLYDRALTDAELRQNHFADLAKFFRLDLGNFLSLGAADQQRIYTAFAFYDLRTSSYTELQLAYNTLVHDITVEGYEAHYLEGDAYAAHNAFIDACIAKFEADGTLLSLDAVYALPLSARAAVYALSGDALTQAAIDDAVAAYWRFDREEYRSYDALYYDAGSLAVAYDFFALNSYWNADRVAGYLPTDTLASSWESRTADGDRYFDRFSSKGRLALLHEGRMAPFTIPVAEQRGFGGFLLLGESGLAADGLSASELGSTVTAELVLRADSAGEKLFSLSGFSFGIDAGVYTAPSGICALTASRGIGDTAVLGTPATYTVTATNAGAGRDAVLSLAVNGSGVLAASGTAMADPTGKAELGRGMSFGGAVYAIRYYRTALTEGQMAQNHFADIAKFYRLDLPDIGLITANAEASATLYAAFAEIGFEDARERVQAIYDSTREELLAEHTGLDALYAELASLVTLEGYQIRIAGTEAPAPEAYAGMRGVFTVDEDLLTALEERGYTVLVDIRARNAQPDHPYRGKTAGVCVYNGEAYVAKSQVIDEVGECFVVTVLYATGAEGSKVPLPDARVTELMTIEVAYDYAVTVIKDGVTYAFTFPTVSGRFGDTLTAKELYHYFGKEGDDVLQGSHKDDSLVKRMIALTPPEKSAIEAPTVGRLTLTEGTEALYTVTLPEGASDAERAAAEDLVAELSALTGAEISLVSEAGIRTDREIVIANGSLRADAAEFAAASAGLTYAIGVSGESILVYAADGAALADALTVLLASVIDNTEGDPLGDNAETFYLPAALSIVKRGSATASAADLTVVLPAGMSTARRATVSELLSAFASRTGITLAVADDSSTVSGRRILLATAADNLTAADLLAASSYTGYAILPAGEDILLSAYSDIALRAALSALLATVSDGNIPTGVTLSCDFGVGAGVPHLETNGTLAGDAVYDAGNGSYTAAYQGATEEELFAYLTLLEASGFTRLAGNARNGCLFATYVGETADLILAFYPMLSELRITVQPKGSFLPTGESEAYTKDPDVTPSVTLMDHELASYVMQLEDGSFLIVDGGDLNRKGAMEKMWEHLTSLTPEGRKPVISLWMATHGHSDHVILMTEFLAKHRDDLVLKAVAFNFPNFEAIDMAAEYAAYGDAIAVDASNLCAVLDRYYPDVERWIPRTGQKHSLAGAEIEILLSHEDIYPTGFSWGNDTSSAWRIVLGGQSIVYLGDCTDRLCRRIASTFGETLESDILQVAHHGVGGGDLTLYQLIDPKICLFGTSVGEFTGDRCNGTGSYTAYNYNAWVRTTDWTRTVNGEEISGERTHYHGSVRTTIPLS